MKNSDRLTTKRVFDNYRPYEFTKASRLSFDRELVVVDEHTETVECVDQRTKYAMLTVPKCSYATGDIVDRLYDYEELGYSPEELKEIIGRYKAQKIAMNSIYGTLGAKKSLREIYDYIVNDVESTKKQYDEWIERNCNTAYMQVMAATTHRKSAIPEIKDVIFNDPATIVFWADGTKTVVKATNEVLFDQEKGLTMAITKKLYGNKGNYFNKIKKWIKDQPKIFDFGAAQRRLDRDRIKKAYMILNETYTSSKSRKGDMAIAIEEAVGLLEQVLDD